MEIYYMWLALAYVKGTSDGKCCIPLLPISSHQDLIEYILVNMEYTSHEIL